uniref:Lipid-binding serum glycoprotein N-terminal domain-containing protein n=1 Tax=Palpitomonas bilix TaxID=652834 RepID=A0A7S3G830_9EUKA
MGKQLVFLTFALLFSSALSTSPGLEVTISESVLSNGWQAGVKVALPHLQSLSIPKTSGKTKTSVGTFAYSVSDIKVTKLKCKSTSAKLKSGEGVDLSASGLTLTVTLKFSFKEESWPHIKTGASATVKVKDGSATLVGLPSSTKDGHLRLSLSKRSVSLGDFDISVDGSMSWLHNFVESLFKSEIKSECEKEIESAIDGQIPQLNTYLASLPTQYAIDMW